MKNLINTLKLAAADDLDMNNMLHCLQPTMKRCMSEKAFSLYLPRNERGTGRQEQTRLLLRCTEERAADSLVKLIIYMDNTILYLFCDVFVRINGNKYI